jgi:hypothetical protein
MPTITVARTLKVFPVWLMTLTSCEAEFTTKALVPSLVTATADGLVPTGTVAVTVFVAVLITVTSLDPAFAT